MALPEWQKELDNTEYVGEAGGGLVKVKVSGLGLPTSVEIDDAIFNSKDKKFISDLFVAACSDGIKKADAAVAEFMTKKIQDAYDQALYSQINKGGQSGGYKN
jgi:nucleoid-associated protein EbfC